jgi:hypothetical protein
VWQVTGRLDLLSDVSAVPKENEQKSKDFVEYYLETQQRYLIRVGVRRTEPDMIAYMQFEIPCEEPAALRRCTETTHPRPARTVTPAALRPPVPTQNHVLCSGCHGVARPFVLMNRPGASKDDGFCQAALATRSKTFKTWEKAMTDALKQDTNKSIVILEVGCDKRMDVSRSYAEKTFKSLKSGKCTFVRIAPTPLDTKKGGATQEANAIALEVGVVSGLTQIDRLIGDKMRKR